MLRIIDNLRSKKEDMSTAKKLTNLQLEILQVFSFDVSEEQVIEIRDMLSKYFAEKLSNQVDQLFEENDWGVEKIEEWSKEHMRTEYKDK